ncbi:MAG: fibro-slime domain-containing protein [Chitinivibrionales bacterium]|nr:fibro-slime domain-containing protein [Chitinivibrionales bacterium]
MKAIFSMKMIGLLVQTAAIALFCGRTAAQSYPDTLWVPVIFYDYRADGSNPDFEACISRFTVTGEAQTFLDSIHKPVYNSNTSGCNEHISEWYRPSGMNGPDINAQFYYDNILKRWQWTHLESYLGRIGEYVSLDYNDSYDMATIIIYDSLPFTLLGDGLYQFVQAEDINDQQFFWINGRGYGDDHLRADCGSGRNYGFATEIQGHFEYRPGLTFEFFGDDDVFVFINDSLVLDLGGVKGGDYGSFNVDDIPGLIEGESYRFSFFHAERKTCGSDVMITTNIISNASRNLSLEIIADTITAGQSGTAIGYVRDQNDSILANESQLIQWSFAADSVMPGDSIAPLQGESAIYTAAIAHRHAYLVGNYMDGATLLSDTAAVFIKPAQMHHLVIEPNSNGLTESPNADNPITSIALDAHSTTFNQLYAILRDQYGNFVSPSASTEWYALPGPDLVVEATNGPSLELGQGLITKTGDNGTTMIVAHCLLDTGAFFYDTIEVTVAAAQYDSLRILNNDHVPISSLTTGEGVLITLSSEGRRTDNGQWQEIATSWAISNDIPSENPPPALSSSWQFHPTDTGLAVITCTHNGTSSLTATVPVSVVGATEMLLRPAAEKLTLLNMQTGSQGIALSLAFPENIARASVVLLTMQGQICSRMEIAEVPKNSVVNITLGRDEVLSQGTQILLIKVADKEGKVKEMLKKRIVICH